MSPEYLELLPVDIRDLVRSLEEKVGIEIEVEVDASRLKGIPGQPHTLACRVDETQARILTPQHLYFPDGAVLHELLHIRRYLVDRIPQIVVCDDSDDWSPEKETGLAQLDNFIEHLVIVPEELSQRPNRLEGWKTKLTRALDKAASGVLGGMDSEHVALVSWALINAAFDDKALHEKGNRILLELNLVERSEVFLKELLPVIAFKELAVKVVFERLRLSPDGVCLRYIDIARGKFSERPLSL